MKTRKKKADASNSKAKKKERSLSTEIIGILLIFLAIFSFLSLVGYDSKDPSAFTTAPPGYHVHNYAGRIGSYFSAALLQLFGLVSFLIALTAGYAGIKAILSGSAKGLFARMGGVVLLGTILSPLFSLLFGSFPWRGTILQGGGLFGYVLSSFLHKYFNFTGSLIFLIAALVLFLMFSTEWSLARTLRFFKRAFDSAFTDVKIKVTRYHKTKKRERMQEKVKVKWSAMPKGGEPDEAGDRSAEKREKEGRARERREEKRRAKELKKEAKKRAKLDKAVVQPAPKPPVERPLFPELSESGDYRFPPYGLLDPGKPSEKVDKNELFDKKNRIEARLKEFNVEGEVREYHPGPVITTYEFFPSAGIKVSQVAGLSEELSLALEAESVRIQRIPGKSSLGVEIPNNKREIIKLRDIIESEKFVGSPSKLSFALGKTVNGEVYITDITQMPHLLIAGATGTGKSVALNALIASILYKSTPDEVKLILVDPKRLEFTLYEGIPHLLSPVINDSKKAGIVLLDAVKKMEERYRRLQSVKVRNIEQYNQQIKQMLAEKKGRLTEEEKEKLKPLPYIVIIIDELAELMMVSPQDVEYCLQRLAQMARAVGIHLVMATQRPSIDVITGTIKGNFSSRIAFRVPSKIDSRIIIDTVGADKLLGLGDMLFMPPNYPRLIRLHCAYISIPEVRRLVKFVREQGSPTYDERLVQVIKGSGDHLFDEDGERDELFDKAVEVVLRSGQASASHLQRRLRLGYARAARIIDQMEQEGIIGPSEGAKPREILVDPATYLKEKAQAKNREDF